MHHEEKENMTTEEESVSAVEEGYNVHRDYWRQAAESDCPPRRPSDLTFMVAHWPMVSSKVKESEWQATAWISMYLELVITTTDRSISGCRKATTEVLSKLEIVKVVVETANEDVEPPNERLKAKSVHVYITFKGLAEPQAPRRIFENGEHVERQAIVRRVMDHTGNLTLEGKLCGGQYIKKRSLALKSRKSPRMVKSKPARVPYIWESA
ncbi:unnamed protein product [Arabidopsis arenosa]|uniref:Uncharacterized protein n=1 Tax=Arabidopsis arenosa TaxID=38785 RepID=A0A8S1ZI81_ARAAE|nr:unnamed protein product [Arabidopsis arenosa]CAE5958387.1 unnamed protein product [Arabidopsis arenosa]